MKITSAEFLKSALNEGDWPRDAVPEIAFLGRSNVGKSSLINSLLGVRGLARTSSTPGRTGPELLFNQPSVSLCRSAGVWVCTRTKGFKGPMEHSRRRIPCETRAACVINSYSRFAPRTFETGFATSRVARASSKATFSRRYEIRQTFKESISSEHQSRHAHIQRHKSDYIFSD